MLRGAEKRMIVVRTRDSRLFEEAYFVVRPEAEGRECDSPDMLWEANRILDSSMAAAKGREAGGSPSPSPRFGLMRGLVWFLLGLGTGGGIASLLWVLL
ncbi:MAG: hypothetical protein J6B24_08590 [Clostridia bacterium]|nr:hypothetical protein [Clostridia bacterium]